MVSVIKDNMSICASKAERVHRYASHALAGPDDPLGRDLQNGPVNSSIRQSREHRVVQTYCNVVELDINVRVDLLIKRMRRDEALFQRYWETITFLASRVIKQTLGHFYQWT